jgi:hypothetical protein
MGRPNNSIERDSILGPKGVSLFLAAVADDCTLLGPPVPERAAFDVYLPWNGADWMRSPYRQVRHVGL